MRHEDVSRQPKNIKTTIRGMRRSFFMMRTLIAVALDMMRSTLRRQKYQMTCLSPSVRSAGESYTPNSQIMPFWSKS